MSHSNGEMMNLINMSCLILAYWVSIRYCNKDLPWINILPRSNTQSWDPDLKSGCICTNANVTPDEVHIKSWNTVINIANSGTKIYKETLTQTTTDLGGLSKVFQKEIHFTKNLIWFEVTLDVASDTALQYNFSIQVHIQTFSMPFIPL